MTKRELERAEKRLEKSLKRLELLYNEDYMLKEDSKERISNFKYYSGFDSYQHKRVVRSISLSYKTDNFITEIQKAAKKQGNFISKDVIINIALYKLLEEKEAEEITDFNQWLCLYTK